MPESQDPLDDGLGPDLVDRGSEKMMGGGTGGGSTNYLDPSYEDALRIMGRAYEIPSPFEQRALTMNNPEAAELARRLTALRNAAGGVGGLLGALNALLPGDRSSETGETVQAFIAALQEEPADTGKLATLRQQIEAAGGQVQAALAVVGEHPAVQAKLRP